MTVAGARRGASLQALAGAPLGRIRRASGIDDGEAGGRALVRHAAFWLRFLLLGITIPTALTALDQPLMRLNSPRMLAWGALLAWTAALYAAYLRGADGLLRRPGVMALDLAVAFAPYAAVGGWENLYVAYTYGPMATAAAFGGLRLGSAVGLLATVAQMAIIWANGQSPAELYRDDVLYPALTVVLGHAAVGVATGALVEVIDSLAARSRALAARQERERVRDRLYDDALGALGVAARSVEEIAVKPAASRSSELTRLAARLRDVETASRAGLAALDAEVERERPSPSARPASAMPGDRRVAGLGGRVREALSGAGMDQTDDWSRRLMAHVAMVLRSGAILCAALALAVGGATYGATPLRIALLAGFVAWTALLWWVLRARGLRALGHPALLGADALVCSALYVLGGGAINAFFLAALGPAILAGAVAGWGSAIAFGLAGVGLCFAMPWVNRVSSGQLATDNLLAGAVRTAWYALSWALGMRLLTAVIGRLEAQGRKAAADREYEELSASLHDGVLGRLSLAVTSVNELAHDRTRGRNERVAALAGELHAAVREARAALQRRRPIPIADAEEALTGVVTRYRALAPTRAIGLSVDETARDLDPSTVDLLAGCAGEAIRNAVRHARAGPIEVDLELREGRWTLTVLDAGSPHPPRPEGRGLSGMRSRLARAGADLSFSTGSDGGRLTCAGPAPVARAPDAPKPCRAAPASP